MAYSVQRNVANVIRLTFLAYILSMTACTVKGNIDGTMTRDPTDLGSK
jgi:hypothetical protein